MKILVVCAGNTCRSPAAEAALRREAERAGLDLEVASAGTSAERAGQPPTAAMVEAGKARDLEISGSATQVTPAHLDSADLILAMDHQTEMFLRTLPSGSTPPIELFGGYDPSADRPEIGDPYGGDGATYAATLDRIIAASQSLVSALSG